MSLRLGELCAGYGGLGMAVEQVFNAETAWFSEYDAAPSKILAHHWPDVPNYGDMTKIKWAAIEHVDIISGGTPCQDLSAAGRRAGMNEGTRSNLWVQMREAIAIQKPRWVVWENVRGAFSACASSEMGQCPGCMDRREPHRPFLRALGRVLGDLSDLGYDCQWRGLRAADVGACHGRFRVFVLARLRDVGVPRYSNVSDVERGRTGWRADADPQQSTRLDRSPSDGHRTSIAQDPDITTGRERRLSASGQAESGRSRSNAGRRDRTPTADAISPGAGLHHGAGGQAWEPPKTWSSALVSPGDGQAPTEGRQSSHSKPPAESQGFGWREGRPESEGLEGRPNAPLGSDTNWGEYEPAIRRWERVLGRPAPRPTEPTGRNNGHRLSPRFTEWMMGLPDGWVTDPAIGISRNEQLKACGNGVVPQQAIAALTDMLAAFQTREAAA